MNKSKQLSKERFFEIAFAHQDDYFLFVRKLKVVRDLKIKEIEAIESKTPTMFDRLESYREFLTDVENCLNLGKVNMRANIAVINTVKSEVEKGLPRCKISKSKLAYKSLIKSLNQSWIKEV